MSLFALPQSLRLSIIGTRVTISHSYFLSHHRECLFHCFSLHVDSNSPDVTEKSVNGLAPCETFRWSVVRAPRRYCLREIRSTTEVKVVARHQYGISVLVPLTSFPGVMKSQVFSHARRYLVLIKY